MDNGDFWIVRVKYICDKKENQYYTEVAQKSGKRFSYEIYYTRRKKLRQRAVEYAIKHDNNAKAARKYHTIRQQIARWRSRHDGTAQSLLPKSRRPLHHPNENRTHELELIRKMYKRYSRDLCPMSKKRVYTFMRYYEKND